MLTRAVDPHTSSVSKNLKNIGIVSFLTVVSRVLGLMRDMFSTAVFGLNGIQDAFVTAFSLPNLFRRLLGEGALAAAFVPKMQEELHARQKAGAFSLLSNVATWLALVTCGLVVLSMVILSQSRRLPIDSSWYLAADLAVLLFPYLAFVCLAAVLSAALNVLGRFTEPALSPIWLNLAMIGALTLAVYQSGASDLRQMQWQCAGVLVGGFLQMAVPAWFLMREGWRPRFDLSRSPAVREIALLMGPSLFGVAVYQINILVSRLIAFSLEKSSASALFFANRLMELPIGVFAIAVSTVVYPQIARHAVQRNYVELANDYRKGIRLILLINIPAAFGLAVLADPIVRLLYERREFTSDKTAVMAPLLALFAVGMPFFSVTSLTTRAFYAVKDMGTPVLMATISFLVNVGLTLMLKNSLGARGLVIASTVAAIVQTVLLQRALAQRLPGMGFRELWVSLGKVLLAAALMGAFVAAGWWGLARGVASVKLASWIAVLALIPLGVAVYAGLLWLLKIEGREEVAAVFAKVRGKFGRA